LPALEIGPGGAIRKGVGVHRGSGTQPIANRLRHYDPAKSRLASPIEYYRGRSRLEG
jgi:hypothetical protein